MSQVYGTLSGVSGSVVIPANVGVVGIAAFAAAGVTNATIEVIGHADVPSPIPDGGALELSPPLLPTYQVPSLLGPVTIRFLNTAGYVVETLT